MEIEGTCTPEFIRVREQFARNFAERGEVGASVCITVDGETVVDLWGGVADPTSGRPWTADTIGHIWLGTKGATALCAHILASRGLLDLNAPVAAYWPEFAKNGKDAILVRHLLAHQAGLPAVREPLPEGAFYDWALMTDALAREQQSWLPGTSHVLTAVTPAYPAGELVTPVAGPSP